MTKPMPNARLTIEDELDDVLPVAAALDMEMPEQVGSNQDHTPSWFTRRELDAASRQRVDESAIPAPPQYRSSYAPLSPEQQSNAQETYRRRLEDRFQLARQMAEAQARQEQQDQDDYGMERMPPPIVHSAFPQRPHGPSSNDDSPHGASTPRRARSALGVSVPVALMLLSLASSIGGVGGYVSANPGVAARMMPASLASLWPFGNDGATTVQAGKATLLAKLEPTARVNVEDVSGAVNAPIPLDISAYPTEPGMLLALKITGLPEDSYITKGKQVAQGEWLVRAKDIRAGELVVTSATQPELGLLVTALEELSGKAAAPAQSMRVALNLDAVPVPGLVPPPLAEDTGKLDDPRILPASAPPEQAASVLPQAIPAPDDLLAGEAGNYVEKGEMLLKVGDIIAARQFFMRAHELKSPEGAYGVARTYDPKVYLDLNVQGLKPNAMKAAEWYGKAAAQGHARAQQALAASE